MAAKVKWDMVWAHRYDLEPIDAIKPYFQWVKDNYGKVGQHRGKVPEHLLPKRVRLVHGDKLCDFVIMQHFAPLVSAKLKALIEKVEPDTHQFEPVTVERQDGTAWDEQYYFFSNVNLLDAISPDLGGVYRQDITDGLYFWEIKSGAENWEKLAVYKDVVARKAIWCDHRFGPGRVLFFSYALLDKIRNAGVTGCDANQCWKEILFTVGAEPWPILIS